jgi:hypothetical protein
MRLFLFGEDIITLLHIPLRETRKAANIISSPNSKAGSTRYIANYSKG